MKKNKIFKALTFIAIAVMLFATLAIPAFADETTSSPQIQINPDFNPNTLLRVIVNFVVGILALLGALFGGWKLVMGQINDDPKERNGGIIVLVLCLVAGALILVVFNSVFK